jgi:hypothetical protein
MNFAAGPMIFQVIQTRLAQLEDERLTVTEEDTVAQETIPIVSALFLPRTTSAEPHRSWPAGQTQCLEHSRLVATEWHVAPVRWCFSESNQLLDLIGLEGLVLKWRAHCRL